jgi:hypothetical protein
MVEQCPKCRQMTLLAGYGLMGGGIGFYWFCDSEGCDFFEKNQDTDEVEPSR